jgi:hypothetical protein
MRTTDLLIWQPHIERPADPRQGELFHSSDDPPSAAVMPEWIARAEAAGRRRAELDARQTWGLRRRLRWALGRGR